MFVFSELGLCLLCIASVGTGTVAKGLEPAEPLHLRSTGSLRIDYLQVKRSRVMVNRN